MELGLASKETLGQNSSSTTISGLAALPATLGLLLITSLILTASSAIWVFLASTFFGAVSSTWGVGFGEPAFQ